MTSDDEDDDGCAARGYGSSLRSDLALHLQLFSLSSLLF